MHRGSAPPRIEGIVEQETYVALDLETTGLSPDRDRIIEIGMVKFTSQGVLDTFATFVNPGRPIPFQITQLTGIRDRDVRDAPTIEALLPAVRSFIGKSTLVGHNVGFDVSFLSAAGLRLRNPAIDTFALAGIVWPHAARYNLATLAEEMGITPQTSHRALEDADTARQLFLALLERARQLPLNLIQDINRLAEGTGWPLAGVFRAIEHARTRSAFSRATLADQLRAKGLLDDSGAVALLGEVEAVEEVTPAPDLVTFDIEEQKALFQPGGLLAQRFPGYEFRPQQVAMLEAVAETLRDGGVLMIEAGTGTGKTLAYLVPAAYYAVSQGKRVVISTNTINLQDQIYQKDIPDLQRILPFSFRAAVLKGRSNYLCLRKLQTMKQSRQLSADEVHALVRILIWAQSTATGDQAELMLPTDTDKAVWSYLSAESETCLNEQCRYFQRGSCFLQRARQRAAGSHLIIVNHSLLLADAAVENAVLPDYDCLIVDEAHHLEDATTKQLSFHVSLPAIEQEIGWLTGSFRGRGFQGLVHEAVTLLSPHLAPDARPELMRLSQEIADFAGQVRDAAQTLFSSLAAFAEYQTDVSGDYSLRLRITEALRVQPRWSQIEIMWDNIAVLISGLRERLRRLGQMAQEAASLDDAEGLPELIRDLAGRAEFWNLVQSEVTAILTTSRANRVDWLEILPEANTASLHSAPLHVGEMIYEYLLSRRHAVVFTSATLRAGEDFSFLRERLGILDAREMALDSPFDYRASTLIYCPTDMPEPSQPFYLASVARAIEQVALALRGRTLVLFTSYHQLRKTVELVGPALHEAGITILAQGNGSSRTQLLQQFKESTDTVLFGTRSFWEGIDVVGPALSCVIITRLPFAVPTEPIFEARSEAFEDPFQQYSVPDAILRFRQGFGRLIRSHSDRGVVVILDRRVLSKRYGQMFLKALPSCTVEHGPLDFVGHRAAQWVRARS